MIRLHVHKCRECEAAFTADQLNQAYKENAVVIGCKYCGGVTELGETRISRLDEAYEKLESNDFLGAQNLFGTILGEARQRKLPESSEALIGNALAQAKVQVIFDGIDSEKFPTLICNDYNEEDFAENDSYLRAMDALRKEWPDDRYTLNKEIEKIEYYKDYIDGIKTEYEKIKKKQGNQKYGVFIAYESDPDPAYFNIEGYNVAESIHNKLPDAVKNVFIIDPDKYTENSQKTRIRYDAAVLYAYKHARCMLVVTDNDIDPRLTGIYTRFYYYNQEKKKHKADNLCFVRYQGKNAIALPGRDQNYHIFDFDQREEYIQFVKTWNHIIDVGGITEVSVNEPTDPEPDIIVDIVRKKTTVHTDLAFDYDEETGILRFGSYPQSRVYSKEIISVFESTQMPSPQNDGDWLPLYKTNKSGKTRAWFCDRIIGQKRYRAVYFSQFRDLYSSMDGDNKPTDQKKHGYMLRNIYCFAFEPLVWNKINDIQDLSVFVADKGIDSQPYNGVVMDNAWSQASLHEWLRQEFLPTAFTSDEQELLGMIGGTRDDDELFDDDRVYLVDWNMDKAFCKKKIKAVVGTDYFRCVGGMEDNEINYFWITSDQKDCADYSRAAVLTPLDMNHRADAYVDCTNVAVLPKIILHIV